MVIEHRDSSSRADATLPLTVINCRAKRWQRFA